MADDLAEQFCNDYGDNPACLKTPDQRYTMRFDDIGQPPILWCAYCGPIAHGMSASISEAFTERGDEFVAEFADAIAQAEAGQTKQ